ncbi:MULTISPECIES: ATP-binding protein [unclassified Streptomyces]|uniref:ATP-binding protein n=1 Tax=unclassified Streptomyces TaxID=2593676 RepID=UPI00364D5816
MDPARDGASGASPGAASPLEASLTFDGAGAWAAEARRLAAEFLTAVKESHGIPVARASVEIVQLVVSELVTNARKYAPGPGRLRLRVMGTVLHIDLWDSSPVLPAAKVADPRRVGEHGLEIVTSLTQSLTTEVTPHGKRLTATVDVTRTTNPG